MNIGVVLPNLLPEFGGATVLTESIIEGLNRKKSDLAEAVSLSVLSNPQNDMAHRLQKTPDGVKFTNLDMTLRGNAPNILISTLTGKIKSLRQPWSKFTMMNGLGQVLDRKFQALGLDIVWFPAMAPCPINTPYVTTVYNLAHIEIPWFPELGGGLEWKRRQNYFSEVLGRAGRIVASTNRTREMILHYYAVDPANVITIPYPVPFDVPRGTHSSLRGHDVQDDPPYFLYPAQFWPHKNHAVLIGAIKILNDLGIRVNLVFTGSDKGNQDFIRNRAEKLGVLTQIILKGFVSRSELIDLYERASALVSPTLIGPDGIPYLEAMSIGCPIISGNSMGTPEWLAQTGNCVESFDSHAWANAMLRALERPDSLLEEVSAGLERSSTLTTEMYVDRVTDVLLDMTANRGTWARWS